MQLWEYHNAQVGHRGWSGAGDCGWVGLGVAVPATGVGRGQCGGAAACFACAFMQLWEYHDAQWVLHQ